MADQIKDDMWQPEELFNGPVTFLLGNISVQELCNGRWVALSIALGHDMTCTGETPRIYGRLSQLRPCTERMLVFGLRLGMQHVFPICCQTIFVRCPNGGVAAPSCNLGSMVRIVLRFVHSTACFGSKANEVSHCGRFRTAAGLALPTLP
jgi:hypothetical protein